MKVLKYLLFGLAGLIASIALIGFFLPADWQVKREITINAPAEKIYALVANLKTGWPQWSEFDKQDPDILYTFDGPELGVGAKRSWLSKKMGNGWQEITSANPTTGVE